jgi:predicted metal-binding membrane protein
MKENQQIRQARAKVIAAVIGGSAVAAMALSMTLHEEQAPGASGGVATGATFIQEGPDMTLGDTATTTTPPAAPETSVAAPPVKATPFGGAGS